MKLQLLDYTLNFSSNLKKASSQISKIKSGGIILSSLLLLSPLLSSCLSWPVERNLVQDIPELNTNNVLAVAFVNREIGSGNPPTTWFGTFNNFFSVITLGLWPLPLDLRALPAPTLWEKDERIHDSVQIGVSNFLNRFLSHTELKKSGDGPADKKSANSRKPGVDIYGRPGGGVVPLTKKQEKLDKILMFMPRNQSLNELLAYAREQNKPFLYIVRLNTFRYITRAGGGTVTNYTGYIHRASRMLINTEKNTVLLLKERPGDYYFWTWIFTNGYTNDFQERLVFTSQEGINYAFRAGGRDKQSADRGLALHLIREDLLRYLIPGEK